MGAPHCLACNSWHYEVPVNPCPADVVGFVRPVEPVNPYVGTVLERWYKPMMHTPDQRKAWAELMGREYVAPKPTVHKKPVESNKPPVLSNSESNSLTTESNKAFDKKQYQRDFMAKKRAEAKAKKDE